MTETKSISKSKTKNSRSPGVPSGAARDALAALFPQKWNVSGWPTLYYIDHKGVIRQKNLRNEEEIDKFLDKLVEEAEKDAKAGT